MQPFPHTEALPTARPYTLRWTLAAAFFALVSTSCSGGVQGTPQARAPRSGLARYTGHATALFDDGIEPQAVGASLEPNAPPDGDSLLRERTQLGDCVARVRVVTITSRREAAGPGWLLGVHTLERLAGGEPPGNDFTLQVDGDGPGAGILRAFEGRMVGMTLVAFLREFTSADGSGDRQLHFHLAGQDKDELHAVRVAALLGEVR